MSLFLSSLTFNLSASKKNEEKRQISKRSLFNYLVLYIIFFGDQYTYMHLLRIHSDINTHTNTIINNILYYTGRIIMFKSKNIQRLKKEHKIKPKKSKQRYALIFTFFRMVH